MLWEINEKTIINEKVWSFFTKQPHNKINFKIMTKDWVNPIKNKNSEDISNDIIRATLTDWDNLSFDDKKLIANTFIKKVVVYDDRLDIVYK